jgi:predicted metal-dependent hydrolase
MEYRLRVSVWTRRVTLRVTPDGRLEVIVPRRTSRRTIADCLAKHRDWIHAQLAEAEARRRALPPPPPWVPPAEIVLPAIAARWALQLQPNGGRGIRIVEMAPSLLELTGAVDDLALCRRALQRWLLIQGRRHLPPWLHALSETHGLPYARHTIRLAQSRWGSCSRGAISLNARLLLLPPPLVDYVLLHELCHTAEANHSPAFWRLVGRHCPGYPSARAALCSAGKQLPTWSNGNRWGNDRSRDEG